MPFQPTWKVDPFVDEGGVCPVMDYIFTGHSEKEVAIIMQVITTLQNRGPEIRGSKMDDRIRGPIRELRKDRHRILYAQVGNTFVLLSAFLKETQKTPPEEIDLAERRLEIYRRTHPDG
ncbi:MAG: type II toxin-antitoxin system RelE/ParE family toxin [Anaerolineaceae bacterium]|nr:type II toxin-antitoxin system RelE/ParE family toxin [Anaerolineaceae bacterium]